MPVIITNGNTTLSQVVTMTIASPCVVTYGVALADQKPIIFATTGALPTGLVAGTTYYVKDPVGKTFNVAATPGGAAIDTSGTQSGVHTISNAFYRVEAYNLIAEHATSLALSTTRTIAVTFANAGNCQGVVLSLTPYYYAGHNTKPITVTLQHFNGVGWDNVATVILTAAQITNSIANNSGGGWFVPFIGGTFPYAVTVDASTWRFQVSQGAGVGEWNLNTSNGTAPFYATWCDNPLTFTDNDMVIAKDVVTIDKTGTMRSLASEDTALLICRSTTPTPDNVANVVWQNPPTSSYTLTIDGRITLGCHSGFRIGTSDFPIPIAQKAILFFPNPTNAAITGFHLSRGGVDGRRGSIFMYGAVPTFTGTTLSADAAASQAVINVVDATGWAVGSSVGIGTEQIFVGGQNNRSEFDQTARYILGISGTQITLSSNITVIRKSGHPVFLVNCSGVQVNGNTTKPPYFLCYASSNFTFRGVGFDTFNCGYTNGNHYDDSANTSKYSVTYCSFTFSTGCGVAVGYLFNSTEIPIKGFDVCYNVFAKRAMFMYYDYGYHYYYSYSGVFTFDHNITLGGGGTYGTYSDGVDSKSSPSMRVTFTNNIFENVVATPFGMYGTGWTISGNKFWGCVAYGLCLFNLTDSTGSGNMYDNCAVGVYLHSGYIDVKLTDDLFGTLAANTLDISYNSTFPMLNFSEGSPTGDLIISTTNISSVSPNSRLRITDNNNVLNADKCHIPNGIITRVGDGLGDTTVRTAGAGKFAMRFEPYHATQVMKWKQTIPTGNIQGKTMNVNVWVKIGAAAYYAGVHTKPTLRVKYDNATEITAVATSAAFSEANGELLSLSFTPATTYGQIEVTIEGATDALTTDKYFYVDDMNVAFPAGVQVDLGGLDLWADGLPVTPAIATMPSLAGVWDEATAAHTAAGSFAKLIKDYLDAAISTRAPELGGNIVAIAAYVDELESRLTALRAGYLDNLSGGAVALASAATEGRLSKLDEAISSRSSHSAADVWTVVSRILTAANNITSDGNVIDQTRIANLDVAVSSRSALTAQQVWEYATRTLSSFGTLVSDVWSYVTRVLTGAGNITSNGGTIDQTKIAKLDASVSSVKSETDKIQAIDDNLDLVKLETDKIQTIADDVDLLIAFVKNKKYLSKVGSVWYLTIRNDVDTENILRKALKDKNGNNVTDIQAGALAQEMASSV